MNLNRSSLKRLHRGSQAIFGGVCGGLAEYIGVDVRFVRMAWAFLLFWSFGSGMLVYIFLWNIVPWKGKAPTEEVVWKKNSYGKYHPPFVRAVHDRKLFGVCGGLALRFVWDASLIRLVFVLAAPFCAPVYLLLMMMMKEGEASPWRKSAPP